MTIRLHETFKMGGGFPREPFAPKTHPHMPRRRGLVLGLELLSVGRDGLLVPPAPPLRKHGHGPKKPGKTVVQRPPRA